MDIHFGYTEVDAMCIVPYCARMLMGHTDYRSFLKWALADRISRNPQYSLRSFARQLNLHHSMVVQIFQNKKRLSVDRAHLVAHRLELREAEYEYFCLLVQLEHAKIPEQRAHLLDRLRQLSPQSGIRDLAVEHFQVMSDWYYMAILQMLDLANPEFTPDWIARRLGISKIEAEVAIEKLERLELIERQPNGRYRKTDSRMLSASAIPHDALRKFHAQMFQKAIESLSQQTPQDKWVGTETFAFDARDLPEAAKLMEQFFDRMVQLASQGENRDHVYHLGTAFFRLTESETGKIL